MNIEAFYYGLEAGLEKTAGAKMDKVKAFLGKHKKKAIGAGVGAAALGGYAAYRMYKKRKAARAAAQQQMG